MKILPKQNVHKVDGCLHDEDVDDGSAKSCFSKFIHVPQVVVTLQS